ncbi:MAG TPA: autotransporter domain-containing protein [Rhabdochlamydiaceae bacterium]
MILADFLKRSTALPAIALCCSVCADQPLGIIGGQDFTANPYAAIVSSTGTPTPIVTGVVGGAITSVGINSSGQGIIGGHGLASSPPYAALVSPIGTATPIVTGLALGQINGVAINSSGEGIIGGLDRAGPAYAAIVSPTGTPTPIATGITSGQIVSVGINSSGQGLIGGANLGTGFGYAALVSPTGTPTPFATGPAGSINSVAINSSGRGIIAGPNLNATLPPFAALVSPVGMVTPITIGILGGTINSVAINTSGEGIIGGQGSVSAYAALVSPTGTPTTLATGISNGEINSVAINSSGEGIIGGGNTAGSAYAAFVSPTGTLTPISTGLSNGVINSVAINSFGQGLIGGQSNPIAGPAYAAIVSPSGIATPIAIGIANGQIGSVAISDLILPLLTNIPTGSLTGNNLSFANYINEFAPQDAFYFVPSEFDGTLAKALESAAPTRNAISLFTAANNLFYLNHSLSNHLRNAYYFVNRSSGNETVASADNVWESKELTASLDMQRAPCCDSQPYIFWFDVIGALSYQKPQDQTVGFDPATGVAILGFDARVNDEGWVGGGAAYAYTHIHEKHDAGHSDINQEYLFVYGSYQGCSFYFDGALWGGLFQIDQVRNIHMTGFDFTSKSKPHGWQLAPHLEAGYRAYNDDDSLVMDPFVMADWVNAWQDGYHEKGSGPFNAGQKEHYSSMLRTEVGVRFYETVPFDCWRLTFEEKGSYVYKKPFHVGHMNTFLVGSPGSFTVETLTTAQNLGVAEFGMIFESMDNSYPYGSITYQGEFGSGTQAHQLCLELGWNF